MMSTGSNRQEDQVDELLGLENHDDEPGRLEYRHHEMDGQHNRHDNLNELDDEEYDGDIAEVQLY